MQRDLRIRRRPVVSGGSGGGFTVGDWHYVGDPGEPALENSFISIADIAPGNTRAAFSRVESFLQLGGLFIGAANTTIFTLPVGFRPDYNAAVFAACVDLGGSGDRVFDGLTIMTDGSVVSGSNPLGYSSFLWATVPGSLVALIQPERST